MHRITETQIDPLRLPQRKVNPQRDFAEILESIVKCPKSLLGASVLRAKSAKAVCGLTRGKLRLERM